MLKWSERRVGPTKYTYTVASLRCRRRRRSAGRTDGYKKKGKKGGRRARASARERGIELRAGKFQAAKEAGGAKRASGIGVGGNELRKTPSQTPEQLAADTDAAAPLFARFARSTTIIIFAKFCIQERRG